MSATEAPTNAPYRGDLAAYIIQRGNLAGLTLDQVPDDQLALRVWNNPGTRSSETIARYFREKGVGLITSEDDPRLARVLHKQEAGQTFINCVWLRGRYEGERVGEAPFRYLAWYLAQLPASMLTNEMLELLEDKCEAFVDEVWNDNEKEVSTHGNEQEGQGSQVDRGSHPREGRD